MASIQQKGAGWYCQFVHRGKRHTFAIGRVTREAAERKAGKVEELLDLLKRGIVRLPAGMDVVAFMRHDGRPPEAEAPARDGMTLGRLRDQYLEVHEHSLEESTLEGIRLHFRHLVATLGERFPIDGLTSADLQGHVDRRAVAKGTRGRRLSPATIRKEIVTLRTAWNWAVGTERLAGRFPAKGLRYPKADEKPPFQSREEIERRIGGGGLKPAEIADLWDALYLTLPEIDDLLGHVREQAAHAWIHPMVCTAAHTGARRGELIRMRRQDVDFGAGTVSISENKRARGKRTTRRVPLSPALADVLRVWLAEHPGGAYLFCHAGEVERSKKRSRTTGHQHGEGRASSLKGRLATVRERYERPDSGPLTKKKAHDHFKRTLAGSKWAVLRGWHVLRHSFISACASRGIDQRLIDEWVGHTTEEMRRRYRHLYPSVQRRAIASVFERE
ncbi:hypothetical protein BH23PLA1_BH23PLA1_39750 [soil metagenome]